MKKRRCTVTVRDFSILLLGTDRASKKEIIKDIEDLKKHNGLTREARRPRRPFMGGWGLTDTLTPAYSATQPTIPTPGNRNGVSAPLLWGTPVQVEQSSGAGLPPHPQHCSLSGTRFHQLGCVRCQHKAHGQFMGTTETQDDTKLQTS